jgi:hypothetical protein
MAEGAVTVPAYVPRLTAALQQRLPGAEVDTEPVRADRFRFIVVWPPFDEMGHPERQRIVWDLAEQVLEPRDLLNVSMILTLGDEDLPQS